MITRTRLAELLALEAAHHAARLDEIAEARRKRRLAGVADLPYIEREPRPMWPYWSVNGVPVYPVDAFGFVTASLAAAA